MKRYLGPKSNLAYLRYLIERKTVLAEQLLRFAAGNPSEELEGEGLSTPIEHLVDATGVPRQELIEWMRVNFGSMYYYAGAWHANDHSSVYCGELRAGRRGHPTRFIWKRSPDEILRDARAMTPVTTLEQVQRYWNSIVGGSQPEQSADDLVRYEFPLRDNKKIPLYLPVNLSAEEADRIAKYISALVVSRAP